jgi:putative SOS response-associated peptidase YedK
VLPEAAWVRWLDPGFEDVASLRALLVPAPAADLALHPVSTLVNKVANNVPECTAPLTTPAIDQ